MNSKPVSNFFKTFTLFWLFLLHPRCCCNTNWTVQNGPKMENHVFNIHFQSRAFVFAFEQEGCEMCACMRCAIKINDISWTIECQNVADAQLYFNFNSIMKRTCSMQQISCHTNLWATKGFFSIYAHSFMSQRQTCLHWNWNSKQIKKKCLSDGHWFIRLLIGK